jgi:hypothetical protein
LAGQLRNALLNRLQSEHNTNLYRSYLGDARREHPRHRGKSPHQIAYFTRSLRREETAFLATCCRCLTRCPQIRCALIQTPC